MPICIFIHRGFGCYHYSTVAVTGIQANVDCAMMGGRLHTGVLGSRTDLFGGPSVEHWVGKYANLLSETVHLLWVVSG